MDLFLANKILGAAVLFAQILVIFILIFFAAKMRKVVGFFGKNAIFFAFLVALTATAGSLFYSEIAGYVPCKLCWFQRIFMYPQVILLGIALIKKQNIKYYIIPLCIIGGLFAAYHYSLEVKELQNPGLSTSCSINELCTESQVWEFGYISIPMMALTAFFFISMMMLLHKSKKT